VIFAVESSCDESAIAIFNPANGIIGEWVHTQIDLHKMYGGVVPDLAGREHLRNFPPMLPVALETLQGHKPDCVAVTAGPGLAGCLALGLSLAKSLAFAWKVPLIGVNHLQGHAYSPFISLHEEDPNSFADRFKELLPHLGLIVSGGNTILFAIEEDLSMHIVAQTVDDAAGEALDKGAKLLGMPYPGGPLVEKVGRDGDRKRFDFPRAFPERSKMKFSFSGLKTSLRYTLEKIEDSELEAMMPDLCASYQEAVVDALKRKTLQVLEQGNYRSIGLSGGVSNNGRLRTVFEQLAQKQGIPIYLAKRGHTGDNAAMIAFAAWMNPKATLRDSESPLSFKPSWALI
jgi:N6-L-threonylcarbamoyladenine synthase